MKKSKFCPKCGGIMSFCESPEKPGWVFVSETNIKGATGLSYWVCDSCGSVVDICPLCGKEMPWVEEDMCLCCYCADCDVYGHVTTNPNAVRTIRGVDIREQQRYNIPVQRRKGRC